MNSWTVPTKFGGKGGGLVQSAGLVLHLMVEESKVCATIDDAIGRFARGALAVRALLIIDPANVVSIESVSVTPGG